jgi:hypothetical protein
MLCGFVVFCFQEKDASNLPVMWEMLLTFIASHTALTTAIMLWRPLLRLAGEGCQQPLGNVGDTAHQQWSHCFVLLNIWL